MKQKTLRRSEWRRKSRAEDIEQEDIEIDSEEKEQKKLSGSDTQHIKERRRYGK